MRVLAVNIRIGDHLFHPITLSYEVDIPKGYSFSFRVESGLNLDDFDFVVINDNDSDRLICKKGVYIIIIKDDDSEYRKATLKSNKPIERIDIDENTVEFYIKDL